MMLCVSGCVLVLVLLLGPECARNKNAAPGPRVLYVLRPHVPSNGACIPCPLLGTLSCLRSSWLWVIVSHDDQLILLYSL
jgi:hypothetical protein